MSPITVYESDILVLNSIAFIADVTKLVPNYKNIRLYLDNDNAGNSATKELMQQFDTIIDNRNEFEGYKDLNEKLMAWN